VKNFNKIIFISAFPPDDRSGGGVVTSEIIKSLANECDDVEIWTFGSTVAKHPFNIPTNSLRRLIGLFLVPILYPLFTGRISPKLICRVLRARREKALLVLNFTQVFIYGVFFPKSRMYLIAHDIVYQNYARRTGVLRYFLQCIVKWSEYIILRVTGGHLFVLSQKDADLAACLYGLKSRVIPWALESRTRDVMELAKASPEILVKSTYFTVFGAWSRPENHTGLSWFLDNVLPELESDFYLVAIGPAMPKYLAKRLSIETRAEWVGFVENPYPIIRRSEGLIAPLFFGAGIKIKCVEALACEVPVFGTDIALEGIDLEKYTVPSVCCNSVIEFVNAINSRIQSRKKECFSNPTIT